MGALFRHFETMGDFMAATASEVLRRQVESFTRQVAGIPADGPALEAILTILRDLTSSPTNSVLYELMIAARTDARLNAHLREALGPYAAKIRAAAQALPGAESIPAETLTVVVALLTNVFDGAALVRGVLPDRDLEEQRIALLATMIGGMVPG